MSDLLLSSSKLQPVLYNKRDDTHAVSQLCRAQGGAAQGGGLSGRAGHLVQSAQAHPLAVIQQTVGQQLGLLPVGGSHVLLPMSFLEGFADPHTSQLAHQRVLIGQPGVIVFNYNTNDRSYFPEMTVTFSLTPQTLL